MKECTGQEPVHIKLANTHMLNLLFAHAFLPVSSTLLGPMIHISLDPPKRIGFLADGAEDA